MAKTISVIFNNKDRYYVPETILTNLKFVFEDFVDIRTYFTEELEQERDIESDVFLVLYRDKVHPARSYTKNLDKVIVLSRTFQREFFGRIREIPRGSNCLVCNDSNESTLQTALRLYELGLNHINMIPYIPEEADSIEGIEYAITPNEVNYVPKEIPNIIDIGDRFLDTATMIRILNLLQLENEKITSNLIRYMKLIVEPSLNANTKYINDYLKNEMIKKVVHTISDAIILTNKGYEVLYVNDMARTLLTAFPQLSDNRIEAFVGNAVFQEPDRDNKKTGVITLQGEKYLIEQFSIMALEEIVGYCIALKNMDIRRLNPAAKRGLLAKYHFEDIVHQSNAMESCIALSKKAALTDYTVLINGESGTGKELLAQSIHNYSKRKEHPFVAVNCAALPESLLESELFGYEKGAFTGATRTGKAGLFEQADGGTIFLDEIGDMSLNLQSRLLRVLQEKQIMRIGSDKIINIDVRILAATNRDLRKEMETGNFRSDLFYRLNIIPVKPVPLRERREDILLILEHFLGKEFSRLRPEDKEALTGYSWPGNIRELQNAAQYYQTIGSLPDTIRLTAAKKDGEEYSIKREVLRAIKENTGPSSGIGRSALVFLCGLKNLKLSDSGMRRILGELSEDGMIQVGKGRSGSRITQKGVDHLHSQIN